MKTIRGFKLKRRVTALFRGVQAQNRRSSGYRRLDPPTSKAKSISRLFSWLKKKAKSLYSANTGRISGRCYLPFDDHNHLVKDKAMVMPKGHMAVYVGQKDGDFHRFLVPVMYFNHPLFGKLLREAEEEYGFNHPGGITIPCRISDFETVQTRIAEGRCCRKLLTWTKAS